MDVRKVSACVDKIHLSEAPDYYVRHLIHGRQRDRVLGSDELQHVADDGEQKCLPCCPKAVFLILFPNIVMGLPLLAHTWFVGEGGKVGLGRGKCDYQGARKGVV